MSTKTEQTVALTLSLAETAANHILRENGIEFTLKFNITSEELTKEVSACVYMLNNPETFILSTSGLSVREILDIISKEEN